MDTSKEIVRIDSLTGLRWWAAFFVFAFHMNVYAPLPFQDYLHIGHTGVSFFFILSGFVLTWSASPKVTPEEFWWRRFSRIWPAHFVALLFALPVFTTLNPEGVGYGWVQQFSWGIFFLSVVLLQGFATNYAIMFSGNPAAWTLSSEAFFYTLHPFIAPRRKVSWAFIVLLALAAIVAGFMLHIFDDFTASVPPPIARTWEFVLGICAAYAVKRGFRLSIPTWAIALALLVSAYMFTWLAVTPMAQENLMVALVEDVKHVILALLYVIIIVVMATRDLEGQPSSLRRPWAVTLGEYSFAFYLVHATVLYGLKRFTGEVPWHVVYTPLVWVGCLLAGLLLASLLHLGVEKPLERRMRSWGKQRLFSGQK